MDLDESFDNSFECVLNSVYFRCSFPSKNIFPESDGIDF